MLMHNRFLLHAIELAKAAKDRALSLQHREGA